MNQTLISSLPSTKTMYRAILRKDPSYDGVFITAVKTTGIFCRPTCPAKKPLRHNVEFFENSRDALLAGYRPCRRCKPIATPGRQPAWVRNLLKDLEGEPGKKLRDNDLRSIGLDPSTVRRWFKKNLGLTFQGYQRALRLGEAMGRLKLGDNLTQVAFEHGYESLSGFREAFQQKFGATPRNGTGKHVVTITRLPTPLGPMLAGSSDRGICLLEFVDRRMIETQIMRFQRRTGCTYVPGNHPMIDELSGQLAEYFSGSRETFTVSPDTPGTPFQQSVWKALQEIPYGETRSYEEQARMIGQPKAVRAVARANGDNRLAIIIPCHRVVGSDGTLRGYGGGLWRKRLLLQLEKEQKGRKAGRRTGT